MAIVKTYDKKVAIERFMMLDGAEIYDEIPLGGNIVRIDSSLGTFICETFCGRDGCYYTRVWDLIE